jgi:SAM-dependent methyltransferase
MAGTAASGHEHPRHESAGNERGGPEQGRQEHGRLAHGRPAHEEPAPGGREHGRHWHGPREHGREFEGPMGLLLGWTMGFGRRRSARLLVDLAGVGAGDRLVDVGCGPGRFLVEAAERGATVVGVDPSSQMRRLARRRTRRLGAAATVLDGTAERLPVEDGSTTVVLAVASFHHWSDPDAGLRELRRILEPGGRVVIAERLARPRGWFRHHALSWDQAERLAADLRRAGFTDVTASRHAAGRYQLVAVIGRQPPSSP